MIIVKNIQQLNIERLAMEGTVALVPTMGNLHQGHLSLVQRGKSAADNVIVSIFVNPLQFSANEDLSDYPQTLDEDISSLENLGVDLLFIPDNKIIYPDGIDKHTLVEVPHISDMYCGINRRGHFRGVTTIVSKLFNLIKPDVAIFGNKDFQQLTIIQKMVNDLAMSVKLIGIPTYREDSGLAMSSRNRYLSQTEKQQAAILYQVLQWAAEQLKSANTNFSAIENTAKDRLLTNHFQVEYFTICQKDTLSPATINDKQLVILSAGKFCKPRLIDNIVVDLTSSS